MISLILGILGLCIGSFLNVVILRLPKSQSVVLPASHCPTCKTPLHWYHNIPLLSWIYLKGKCFSCKTPISFQYPLIEASCGALFVYFSTILTPIHTIAVGLTFSCLLALSVIDFRYKAVPDLLSLPTLLFALFSRPGLQSLEDALLFAGGFALLRILVSAWKKREAMGEADIIIAAIIGAMVGGVLGLVAIYLSAIFALIGFVAVRKRDFELPFIPFLSLGLFCTFVFKEPLLKLVEVYFG
jgi:leader peptidase (prepilin peptidase)/N-methyltransferase